MVQACHAAQESGFVFPRPFCPVYLVLLRVDDEQQLLKIQHDLNTQKIRSKVFYEPDNNMGYSSLATEPLPETSRSIFKKYKLWTCEVALGKHGYKK